MLTSTLDPIAPHRAPSILPIGASVGSEGVTYRVWAPKHGTIRVRAGDGTNTRCVNLEREGDGFFAGRDDAGKPGDVYWYDLDGRLAPDPASRFQPRGVEGPSQVVDPRAYQWRSEDWRRPPLRGRIIYELHVGTFTPEGTFRAAVSRLDALVDLGVNAIELMPLADFPGGRNWGYDGVMLFAPARCYGTPDELRDLIDAAHARGLAVIVDVVYNHLGPCGNVLPTYSDSYFRQENSMWGAGLNFDGEQSGPVRQYFLQNACMWFDEYRVDGLRLDAVHAIRDAAEPNVIAEIAAIARSRGGFTIAEDERNEARIITASDAGGWGVDGMWSDDFHHTVRVALTGQREAHFANYRGTLPECVAALDEGWIYSGQEFPTWGRPRGSPAGHLRPEQFVLCISNHDQVGNRPLGDRLSDVVSVEIYRAASMLLCLSPYTPMLFQGQEWAATSPFPYFTDLPGDVGANIRANRLREFAHNKATYDEATLARMPDPQANATFEAAKLKWGERESGRHGGILKLYRECLRLRKAHPHFQSPARGDWEVGIAGPAVLGLRWRVAAGDWLLLVSLGWSPMAAPASPLVLPAKGRAWQLVVSSNDMAYGGDSTEVILLTATAALADKAGAILLREHR